MSRTLLVVAVICRCFSIDAVQGNDPADSFGIDRPPHPARLDAEKIAAAFRGRMMRRFYGGSFSICMVLFPSAERTAQFLESRDPEKRGRLIEELLASPRFGEHFADVWRSI